MTGSRSFYPIDGEEKATADVDQLVNLIDSGEVANYKLHALVEKWGFPYISTHDHHSKLYWHDLPEKMVHVDSTSILGHDLWELEKGKILMDRANSEGLLPHVRGHKHTLKEAVEALQKAHPDEHFPKLVKH